MASLETAKIRSILCVFCGSHAERTVMEKGWKLAQKYNAYIRFLIVSPDPRPNVNTEGKTELERSFIAKLEEQNSECFRKIQLSILEFAKRHNISLNKSITPLNYPAGCLEHKRGDINTIVLEEGKLSDMILINRGYLELYPTYDRLSSEILESLTKQVVLMNAKTH